MRQFVDAGVCIEMSGFSPLERLMLHVEVFRDGVLQHHEELKMGLSFQEVMQAFADGAPNPINVPVNVAIVANQDSLLCMYAKGALLYEPGAALGSFPRSKPAKLSTSGVGDNARFAKPLRAFFSDREVSADPQAAQPGTGQWFDAKQTDEIGFSLSQNQFSGAIVGRFKLLTWGGGSYSAVFEPKGKVLVGAGPGGEVYVVSFAFDTSGPR